MDFAHVSEQKTEGFIEKSIFFSVYEWKNELSQKKKFLMRQPLVVPFFWLRPHFAGAVPAVKAVKKYEAVRLSVQQWTKHSGLEKNLTEYNKGAVALIAPSW